MTYQRGPLDDEVAGRKHEAQTLSIMEHIVARADEQAEQWPAETFDDTMTGNDWVALICKHAGKAFDTNPTLFEDKMLDVGALIVNALRSVTSEGRDAFLARYSDAGKERLAAYPAQSKQGI